ncbi:MAG: hypothetical protein ACLRS8_15185 [Parabacteroides merdae]
MWRRVADRIRAILLLGIPIYNADHMLGVYSIFTPEAMKKVTLFKGSFPARYGGRLSSIVDIRTNDGDMQNYHGTVSIGLLTSKLLRRSDLER